jgi:hypothetical protein
LTNHQLYRSAPARRRIFGVADQRLQAGKKVLHEVEIELVLLESRLSIFDICS